MMWWALILPGLIALWFGIRELSVWMSARELSPLVGMTKKEARKYMRKAFHKGTFGFWGLK